MAKSKRNITVEKSVEHALQTIDRYISGCTINQLPEKSLRRVIDKQLSHKTSSVRVASLFFVFYALEDKNWNYENLPIGLRGKWGDKKLSNELTLRNITLHSSITAFGEKLGWKGNVHEVRLSHEPNFSEFINILSKSSQEQNKLAAEYIASRFSDSKKVITPLPAIGSDILTYARARVLLTDLISVHSEGIIQQLLIAGILNIHRKRFSHTIKTHHVHASDKFDGTVGDIEEYRGKQLVAAYEVTVRPDWKNRVSDFRSKMDKVGLSKYVIFASNVNKDDALAKPAEMLKFLEPYGRDIAVVDIMDAIHVFAAELSADELRQSLVATFEYLTLPNLCGRADIIEKYKNHVNIWLDDISN